MPTLLQDLRYAARTLAKNPGFAAAAALTLALGVGANTAIFSVVNGVLLRPLPFAEPERLMIVWETDPHNQSFREGASVPDFFDWKHQSRRFERLAASTAAERNLTGPGKEPERLEIAAVSHDLFALLKIEPSLGRAFRPEEDEPGGARVAILSHGIWQSRYGGAPEALGQIITLDGRDHEIVGVMPTHFGFPADAPLWVPLASATETFREVRGVHNLTVLGRLKRGATREAAQAEMAAIAAGLEKQYPEDNRGRGAAVESLHEAIVGRVRPALLTLLGAVGLVLLIACANVASLMLARASTRSREIAIRTSLGASRFRLVRQLLTESVLLALIGGAVGLAAAFWGLEALLALSPANLPRSDSIGIDLAVLGFSFALSVVVGVVSGLVPAIQSSSAALSETLNASSLRAGVRGGTRGSLVVAEVAMAVVLAVGAGLLIKSFSRLRQVDPGFRTENLLTLRITLPESKYPTPPRSEYPRWPKAVSFYERLLERSSAVPGVISAAVALNHPLASGWTSQIEIVGRPEPPGARDEVRMRPVSPGYFQTIGVPVLKGRAPGERDRQGTPLIVAINEAMARKYFPGEDAIGRSVRFWGEPREIVGVVRDVRFRGLGRDVDPAIYPALSQMPMSEFSLVVKTRVPPLSVLPALRTAVRSIDSDLALFDVATLEQLLSESVGAPRFHMVLLTAFGALALLLAAVGIYGLLSYSVAQRTREIGIRSALGARRADLLRLVVGEGLARSLLGLLLGLVGAFVLTRFLAGLLFQVGTRDPYIFASVVATLLGVAFLASYLPARRAAKMDPMLALRNE